MHNDLQGLSSQSSKNHTDMKDTSGVGTARSSKVSHVMMTTPQLFLARIDAESILVFLRKYEWYCGELNWHSAQLLQVSSQSLEPIGPVGLVYYVDAEQLESTVDMWIIKGFDDVEKLTDDKLQTFLDKRPSTHQ